MPSLRPFFLATFLALISNVLPSNVAHAANKTWSGNFPLIGSVTIPAGDVVTLDTNVALTDLTVNGELVCANKSLNLSANWIMVHGAFRCGTPEAPYTRKFNITLTGAATDYNVMGMGTKFLGAMGGGSIELHGENRLGWTRLSATANKGTGQITLKEPPGWRVGDRIVITSTDYRAEHAEERRITAITGNKVTVAGGLEFQHWCASNTFGAHTLEECAEVGLLTRNIVIKGDTQSAAAGFGGHVMVMTGSSARISGVQFLNMGQKGRIGRYPMHWHLTGSAPGQYLNDSSIVHSYNRFLSVHGTHNIRLARNVAYDTIGHGYYLEDGIERDNIIEDNLGVLVRNATDGLPTPSDKNASVFWISNPDNIVRRNVSAGSQHTGFWLGFPEHPIGLSATLDIWPRRTPLKLFSDNVSHSNGARGLYVDGAENAQRNTITTWYEPRLNPADRNSAKVPPIFRNFVSYKNRYEGVWLRSRSNPVLQSAKLADNGMGAYFTSMSTTPGYIQDSLIVGETGNKGNPSTWETKGAGGRELPRFWSPADSIRGLEYYDGPMAIRRTLFANFTPNTQRKAGGITNLSPNPFWISSANTSSDISFLNGNEVWLDPMEPGNDGDAFSIIRDSDGSITGTPNRRIVPRNPVLYTSSCTLKSQWNAYVCPHNYIGVQIFTYDGVDISGTVLRRDDGASHILGSADSYPEALHFMVLENRPHALTLPIVVPKRITFSRVEGAGRAARLSLPYPTSDFTLTLWGSPITKATGLDELGSGGTKYYYDAAAKQLHMRLVTPTGSWQEYEIRRP
jgi:cell surface hyaluronidase